MSAKELAQGLVRTVENGPSITSKTVPFEKQGRYIRRGLQLGTTIESLREGPDSLVSSSPLEPASRRDQIKSFSRMSNQVNDLIERIMGKIRSRRGSRCLTDQPHGKSNCKGRAHIRADDPQTDTSNNQQTKKTNENNRANNVESHKETSRKIIHATRQRLKSVKFKI